MKFESNKRRGQQPRMNADYTDQKKPAKAHPPVTPLIDGNQIPRLLSRFDYPFAHGVSLGPNSSCKHRRRTRN